MLNIRARKTNDKSQGNGHRGRHQSLTIALFLLPTLVLFTIFVILPIGNAVYTSMYKWNGLGPLDKFLGLGHYDRMFGITKFTETLSEQGTLREALDAAAGNNPFLKALTHNLVIIALSLGIQLPVSLGIALLVGRKLPGRVFFRTVFFLPYVISQAITAFLWGFIFNPRFSMIVTINNIIHALYPPFEPGDWLGNTDRVLVAIFIVLTWQFFGLHMILYIAGLQQIPEEVEEAALIDGANRLQNLLYIVLPMLSSTIVTTIYLSVLGSLQQFALVWIMTEGGPANASELLATFMYRRGFVAFQLGYGSAVAVIIFLICLAFSLVYQRLVMRQEYVGRAT
jgi:raffinose/stachyose/melibiose transport system permease protein